MTLSLKIGLPPRSRFSDSAPPARFESGRRAPGAVGRSGTVRRRSIHGAFAPKVNCPPKRVRSRQPIRRGLIYAATHLLLPVVVAYATATLALSQQTAANEERDREYVGNLQVAARNEARANGRRIRAWTTSLVGVTKSLETFVNDATTTRPGVNPGHAGLTMRALEALVQSPVAARQMEPCMIAVLGGYHYRLKKAVAAKDALDIALIEYTATFPKPIAVSYEAAARLHAHIENLLMIYKGLPGALDVLGRPDTWTCDNDK